MSDTTRYNIGLSLGLGLIDETKTLLSLWEPGMSGDELYRIALDSGRLPTVSAYRLRNIVVRCFAPRYLTRGQKAAKHLKFLSSQISAAELEQLMFIYTSRANAIFGDFVRLLYWPRYTAGYTSISNEDAKLFIEKAIDLGKTEQQWSKETIRRMSGYLTGCCADYGLLERGRRSTRNIIPFRIAPFVVAFLAYELHFSGVSDNAILTNEDWQLFGLTREDVLEEIKRLSLKGFVIVQKAGDLVHIAWKQQHMEELCDVLIKS